MTIPKLKTALKASSLRASDVQWFPRWIEQYRRFLKPAEGDLPVERASAIAFLRHIKAQGKAVWQRLQAVRFLTLI